MVLSFICLTFNQASIGRVKQNSDPLPSLLSTHILPSHGYGMFIDYGGSVRVAGLTINSGDLLVGDKHGVAIIPEEIPLLELAQVAAKIDSLESEIFVLCQSDHFSVEKLAELDASVAARWPKPSGKERVLRTA